MKHYEVEYHYYRYNSGLADNGHYVGKVETVTLEEAQDLASKINISRLESAAGVDQTTDIIDTLLDFAGHFTKPPVVYRVEKTPIQ